MQEVTNGREIRVIGMSRSGNHAVVNWMLSQLAGRYCFLNCAEPGTNPYRSARAMGDGRRALANYPLDLHAEQAGRLSPKDHLVYSHEDVFLSPVGRLDPRHAAWVGESAESLDVLILRDPFNLFASRIKSGFDMHMSHATAMRIWKQHAREALKPRHLRSRRVVVRYNDWVTDRRYRASLSEWLGLGFGDRGLDRVVNCNGGSSFDGLNYDGRASEMRVLERWHYYRHEPAFRALFDHQVKELSEALFGPISGAEIFSPAAAVG